MSVKDTLIGILLGAVAGILYNEHIFLQAKKFPSRNPLISFWVRFILFGAVALWTAVFFGNDAFLAFVISSSVVRMGHTFLRAKLKRF